MITITSKNIYYNEFSLYQSESLDTAKVVDNEDIVMFLSDYVEFGESVTFKRLFEIISDNVEKFNEIFYSSLGGYKLDPFLQEIENDVTENIESDILEVHWFCDKFEDEITIEPSLHGLSSENKTEAYAIDFVSLNNVKYCNVILNTKIELFDYNKVRGKKKVSEENLSINIGNRSFTVFDLFNGILKEISFHGGPQDKYEKFKELEESIKEIESEEDIYKSSMSFDEMIKKFESEDIYLVKYKDLRDRVDKNRLTIDKNLVKLKKCLKDKLKIYYEINKNELLDNNNYYKNLTNIEYNMQLLYGEEEDISYHIFWNTPKCTCPKIDNLEIYPSDNPIFDKKCSIHKKMM
jgi:hypothetical protein